MDGDRVRGRTELLSRVARALADATVDPETLLEAVATQVAMVLDAFCGFLRVSPERGMIEPIATAVPEHLQIHTDAAAALNQAVPLAHDTLLARAVHTRATVHVAQITEAHIQTRFDDEASREAARRVDMKGAMFVPVFVAGAVRGVLMLIRCGKAAQPFDDDAQHFAERLADKAALALANADLLHAAQDRAARLQLISDLTRDVAAAANDYPRLLDVIVRRVGSAMADSCVLRVVRGDGEGYLSAAVYNRDPADEAFHRTAIERAGHRPSSITERVRATNRSVLIPSVDEEVLASDTLTQALGERRQPSTILAVPLREGGLPTAVLLLARSSSGTPFTPADLALVEDVAAHATVAIANARAIERSEQAAARLRILTDASAAFADAHGDSSQILDTLAHRLADCLGGLCTIQLLAPDGETLEPATTIAHPDPDLVERVRALISAERRVPEGLTRRILAGESIMLAGTPQELAKHAQPRVRQTVEALGARSVIGLPLQAGSAPIGAVVMMRTRGTPFTDDDLLMARDMVRHGALAVRNSRLLAAVQHELAERERAESALRASEEQLRQAQKMDAVGRLAGGVAHDFNNLLSVVLSSCDFLEEAIPPGAPLLEDVTQIRRAGVRAASLTRQLLAFSRQQAIERRVLDLNDQVKSVQSLLQRLLGEDCELVTRLAPSLGSILADATHIEQVVMNLAINARDAMPRGGRLSIETANVELDSEYAGRHFDVPPGRYVMLTVSDTGEGMTKEVQERIFEPFFTTKPRGKGTGLGLSTVFGIVKQNAGTIWVYSEPGIGTTFRVYFPRTDEAAKPFTVTGKLPRIQGFETVLVVEDEDAVRKTIVAILTRGGYRVVETTNGNEALARYETHDDKIDLLLTDVVMPGMGGPELVKHLQARGVPVKVLYMSGYTADKLEPHDIGDVALLPKPFTPSSVLRKVREMLDAT